MGIIKWCRVDVIYGKVWWCDVRNIWVICFGEMVFEVGGNKDIREDFLIIIELGYRIWRIVSMIEVVFEGRVLY